MPAQAAALPAIILAAPKARRQPNPPRSGTGQRASAFLVAEGNTDMSHSTARRFRQLAADALAEAALLTDPAMKRLLIDIAASYERLAEGVEAREAAAVPTDRK